MFRQWNTWILLSSKLYSEKLLSYGQESTIVPSAFQSLKVSMGTNNCDLPPFCSGQPKHKKLLEQELARYVRLLTEHGNPEKVILFGTLATGGFMNGRTLTWLQSNRPNCLFSKGFDRFGSCSNPGSE